MNLSKCERCGCFFVSNHHVCPSCEAKDNNEMSKLKNFLTENENIISAEDLSFSTGISVKNLNRYLASEDFSSISKNIGNGQNINISTSL